MHDTNTNHIYVHIYLPNTKLYNSLTHSKEKLNDKSNDWGKEKIPAYAANAAGVTDLNRDCPKRDRLRGIREEVGYRDVYFIW